jgi:hypothetical protein
MTHKSGCNMFSNHGIPKSQKDESHCSCISSDNRKILQEFLDDYHGFIWSQDRKAGEQVITWLLNVLEAKDKEFVDYLEMQGPPAL